MPNHFLKKSKTGTKSPESDFFDHHNGQNMDVDMAKSVDFWVH